MKTIITSQNETINVTKKFIKEIFELERPVGYYSYLDGNTFANAITYAQEYFGWDGTETKQDKINDVYNESKEVIESYISYQKHLNENTL